MSDSVTLTIESVQDFKKKYLGLLVREEPVTIDFTEISEIDLSGFQLLVSLVRSAEAKNKKVCFTGTLTPEVRSRLFLSGIGDQLCETGEQFGEMLTACME